MPVVRSLFILSILLFLLCAQQRAAAQPATQDYAAQLKEYDQRVAEQNYSGQLQEYDKRVEDQKKMLADQAQQRSSLQTPLMIALCACLAFLLYTVVRGVRLTAESRRRAEEARQSIAESQRQMAEAIGQNTRIIQLLESINGKMNHPTA